MPPGAGRESPARRRPTGTTARSKTDRSARSSARSVQTPRAQWKGPFARGGSRRLVIWRCPGVARRPTHVSLGLRPVPEGTERRDGRPAEWLLGPAAVVGVPSDPTVGAKPSGSRGFALLGVPQTGFDVAGGAAGLQKRSRRPPRDSVIGATGSLRIHGRTAGGARPARAILKAWTNRERLSNARRRRKSVARCTWAMRSPVRRRLRSNAARHSTRRASTPSRLKESWRR